MAVDRSYKVKIVVENAGGTSQCYGLVGINSASGSSSTSTTSGNISSSPSEVSFSFKLGIVSSESHYSFATWSVRSVTYTTEATTNSSSSYARVYYNGSSSYATTSYVANQSIVVKTKWASSSSDEAFEDSSNLITITLTATFTADPKYTVSTSVSPSGYGTVTGAGTYWKGSSVTLTATAYTGYSFNRWSSAETSTSITITNLSSDISRTAYFVKNSSYTFGQYKVKIAATAGTNGSITAGSSIVSSSSKDVKWSGSTQNTASGTVTATPNRGYKFNKWTAGTVTYSPSDASVSGTSLTFTAGTASQTMTAIGTMNGAASLVQNFPDDGGLITFPVVASFTSVGTAHTLTVKVQDTNGNDVNWGTVNVSPSYDKYYLNESIDLSVSQTTSQSSRYEFVNYTFSNGYSTQTSSSHSFLMPDSDLTVIAVFRGKQFTVTLDPNGGNRDGTLSTTVRYEEELPDITIPTRTGYNWVDYRLNQDGSSYQYWYNDGGTIKKRRTWNRTQNTTLYAQWEIQTFSVTTRVSPGSSGTVTGGGSYDYNSLVTLTQTPAKRYKFVKWTFTGDLADSTAVSTTFFITYDVIATAHYELNSDYEYKTSEGNTARFRVRIHPTIKSGQESFGTVSSQLYSTSYTNITEGGLSSSRQGTIKATANSGYQFKQWKFKEVTHSTWNTSNSSYKLLFANTEYSVGGTYSSASVTTSVAATFAGAASMVDGEYTDNEIVDFVIEAEFEPIRYQLLTATRPTNHGSITVTPSSSDYKYDYNSEVTVQVTPDYGYTFNNWDIYSANGGFTGDDNPYTFNMPYADSTAYAILNVQSVGKYRVCMYASSYDTNQGTISMPSSGTIYQSAYQTITVAGETFIIENPGTRITAEAKPGYHFKNWTYEVEEPQAGWSNYWDESSSYIDFRLLSSNTDNPNAVSRCEVKFVPKTGGVYSSVEQINIAVVAHFEENTKFQVDVIPMLNGVMDDSLVNNIQGDGSYSFDSSATISVTPVAGAMIQKWELYDSDSMSILDTQTSSSTSYTFTMPSTNVNVLVYMKPQNLGTFRLNVVTVSEDTDKGTVSGGGTSDQKDITVVGETASLYNIPIQASGRNGYVFKNWTSTCSHTGTWDSAKSRWSVETDVSGSTGSDEIANAQAKYVGVGDYVYDEEDEIVTITLTAHFVQYTGIPYHLLVKAVAGSGGEITNGSSYSASDIVEVGTQAQIENQSISCYPNTGYHFVNWTQGEVKWSASDGVGSGSSCVCTFGDASSASTTVTTIANWVKVSAYEYDQSGENVVTTAVANFAPNTYTVTFNKNGGSGGTSSVTVTFGQAMTSPQTLPTRTGYSFVGYFTQEVNGVKYYNANGSSARTCDLTSNTILYAHWTPLVYDISYSLGGGTYGSNHPTSANWDSEITISNPTKTDCEFLGWTATGLDTSTAKYGTSSADTSWSNGSTKVTSTKFKNLRSSNGTVTLTANWKRDGLPVKVYINGGWEKCKGIKKWNGSQWVLVPAKKYTTTWE